MFNNFVNNLRIFTTLLWLIPSYSLFEVYNGVIDGNTCTGTTPSSTSMITIHAPINTTVGNIGIQQLAFQTVGDYYTYTGQPITMNGVSGTYNSKCCSCHAISQSINGGFSECGLTWCGKENQWQYIDFVGTSLATVGIPQNDTITIQFSDPIPIVTNINGYPIYSISYNILTPPSSSISPSTTRTASITQTETISSSITRLPTISNSVIPSATQSPSLTLSETSSSTLSETPSATLSKTPSATLSTTPSETSSATLSATLSATPSITLSETPSATLSATLSTTPSETSSATPSATLSATPSITLSETPSATPSITLSETPSATLSATLSETSSATLSATPSATLSTTLSETPSATPSITPSETLSTSETPSVTQTNSVTPSITSTNSVTQSITPTTSLTSSITSSVTNSRSVSRSETPEATISISPSISPSGICYSVSTLYGTAIILSSGWIIVNTGINVTQAYGGGYISMGQFQSCQINALNKCVCSYTQGSTVAGCSGKRNSYITYSYGSTTDITYTNESPTCSYNFAGTIGIPPSTTPTPSLTPSITRTISRSITSSVSFSPSMSQTRSETPFPTSTPLTRPVLIADSVADFPTIQGGNGWYYNYYDGTNVLHPMPYYGSSTAAAGGPFWQVQNSVCIISNAYAHTGHTSGCITTVQGICKPTIFWNNTFMNNNTNYIVSYTAGHPSNPAGTDGVKMTLKQNGIILSNVFPTVNIAQTNYSIYNLSSVELIIDPLTQCNSDASTYNLKIYQYQVYPSVSFSITSTLTPSVTLSLSQTPTVSRTLLDSVSQSVSPISSLSVTSTETPSISITSSPSSSYSPTISQSASVSPSFSSSVSKTNSITASITASITSSESSTISVSETITPTLSESETLTPSLSASITPSYSITNSYSFSVTPSESTSYSLSISISSTGSKSATSSSSLSKTASTSKTATATKTESITSSLSSTSSKTISSSKSISNSIQPTQSNTVSVTASITQSESLTSTVSATAIVSSNVTTTPLVYCIPYPSSSPTSDATSTSTPQFLITPWPTNGSASASTSPLFMMIPYPSSSHLPINITVYEESFDSTGAIVGGTAIGALGIGSLFFLYNYLKPKQIQKSNEEKIEIIERINEVEERVENEDKVEKVEMVENIEMVRNVEKVISHSIQSTAVKIQSNKELSYICVSTNDLEEIKQILIINGKRFKIMEF